MNVVIYARFSSHSQTEQSIEGQLKACYEYAERNSYTVIGEYIDRALTGTNDNRPEFLRMIEDSRKKTFQGILVYQLDRFARNRYDSAVYKPLISGWKRSVLSVCPRSVCPHLFIPPAIPPYTPARCIRLRMAT